MNDPLNECGTRSRTTPRGVVHAPPCQAPRAAHTCADVPHGEEAPLLPFASMPVQHGQSVRLASTSSRRDARASPPRHRGAAALTRPAARQWRGRYVLHLVDVDSGGTAAQPDVRFAADGEFIEAGLSASVQRARRAEPTARLATERAAVAAILPQALPRIAPVSRT